MGKYRRVPDGRGVRDGSEEYQEEYRTCDRNTFRTHTGRRADTERIFRERPHTVPDPGFKFAICPEVRDTAEECAAAHVREKIAG